MSKKLKPRQTCSADSKNNEDLFVCPENGQTNSQAAKPIGEYAERWECVTVRVNQTSIMNLILDNASIVMIFTRKPP